MNSLDFCYTKYLLFLGEGEMPFDNFADEGPAEKVCERTENVYSDSIICETITIPVQRTSNSDN